MYMNIGNFELDNILCTRISDIFKLSNSKLYLFLYNNGFCITQNINKNINLNIFLSKEKFKLFELKKLNLTIEIIPKDFNILNNFNLYIAKDFDYIHIKGKKTLKTKILHDCNLYNFCKNYSNLDDYHNLNLNDNEIKTFLSKYYDIDYFLKIINNYEINLMFYKNTKGCVIKIKDINLDINYIFSISK